MYKISGGTDHRHKCGDCGYLRADTESKGFGGRSGSRTYCCGKHPDTEEEHLWNPKSVACKLFSEANVKTVFMEDNNGQLSFLGLGN